jgi:DNA polymerase III delta prime subunit
MPKILRHPVGRVALQFSSYPLKQSRFLLELIKKDPVAFIKYIAYAEGINYSAQKFLDTDLSNALGFGITWSEALDAIKDFAGGDFRGAIRHGKQAFPIGGGIIPSGPGPAVSGVSNIYQKAKEGKGSTQAIKEITPIMYQRVKQAIDAVKNEKDNMYPVKDSYGHVMYYVSKRQLIQRTIGPKTAMEGESYKEYEANKNLEYERTDILRDMTNSILDGDKDRVKELVKKYHIFPSDRMINNELMNRNVPKSSQKRMGLREQYQQMRKKD